MCIAGAWAGVWGAVVAMAHVPCVGWYEGCAGTCRRGCEGQQSCRMAVAGVCMHEGRSQEGARGMATAYVRWHEGDGEERPRVGLGDSGLDSGVRAGGGVREGRFDGMRWERVGVSTGLRWQF